MAAKVSPFREYGLIPLGRGRYYDEVNGKNISRRQAEKLLGRESFEAKAKRNLSISPETQAARPARGRVSARTAKLTPAQVKSRTEALAKMRAKAHAPRSSREHTSAYFKKRNADGSLREWIIKPNVGELAEAYKIFKRWSWVYGYYINGLFVSTKGTHWYNLQPATSPNTAPDYGHIQHEIDGAGINAVKYGMAGLAALSIGFIAKTKEGRPARSHITWKKKQKYKRKK